MELFSFEKAKEVFGLPEKWEIETGAGTLYAKPFEGRGSIEKWLSDCKGKAKGIAIARQITETDAEDAAQIMTLICEPNLSEEDAVRLVTKFPSIVPEIQKGFTEMMEAIYTKPRKKALDGIDEAKN